MRSATAENGSGFQAYAAPATIAAAARLLADGEAVLLAGGTDLMLGHDPGQARHLVNIGRIEALRGIEIGRNRIRIGALATVSEVLEHDDLRRAAPLLAMTADRFASPQIRNAATVGGNIANASPAADMVVSLLALDAEVELTAWRDGALTTRRLPLAEVITGPGATVIARDEILTTVDFARPAEGHFGGFEKSGPRPALEIAVVSAALAGGFRDGALRNVRIALGAVAPTPIRAEAARVAAAEADPIDDVRGSAWYRRHLVSVYVGRLLADALPG